MDGKALGYWRYITGNIEEASGQTIVSVGESLEGFVANCSENHSTATWRR
jgi:hypothetical protein